MNCANSHCRLPLLHLLALLLVAALAGCGSSAVLMKADDTLAPNEGILALRIHSPFYRTYIEIDREEGPGPVTTSTPSFDGGAQTLLIRLPEGTYSNRRMYADNQRFEADYNNRLIFKVTAGQIAYLGHLYISNQQWNPNAHIFDRGNGGTFIRWADQQSAIESYLQSVAPEMLERYPIEYAVTQE